LEGQLAPGGRLFVILGEEPVMEATLITRYQGGALFRRDLFETAVPALANVAQAERFVF
jgi:protein-L-isoaspartate(D-aspartate) O-methyltransferase